MTACSAIVAALLLGTNVLTATASLWGAGEQPVAAELETWRMPQATQAEVLAAFDAAYPGVVPSSYACDPEAGTLDGEPALLAACRQGRHLVYLARRVVDLLDAGVEAAAPGVRWDTLACSSSSGTVDGQPAQLTSCRVRGARMVTSMSGFVAGDRIVPKYVAPPPPVVVEATPEVIP